MHGDPPPRYAPDDSLIAYALAPQHGPVVRTCTNQLVREYSAWAAAQVRLTVNGQLSLKEARLSYQECGAADRRFLPYVRPPEVSEQ